MINGQNSKFNLKVILYALCLAVIALVVIFSYNNAKYRAKVTLLKQEETVLSKNLTIMKADVDRLSALNEVNDIELQSSRYKIQQLLDSIGRLNLSTTKLQEYKNKLLRYEFKIDSFKIKNTYLQYKYTNLRNTYKEIKTETPSSGGDSSSLVEKDTIIKEIPELDNALKAKSYLKVNNSMVNSFRFRGSKSILTHKASVIQKLSGCVTIAVDAVPIQQEKVIYFQFLDPFMNTIKEDFNGIDLNGKVYSKRVTFILDEHIKTKQICDGITIPKGSFQSGKYIFNVFEEENLLLSREFILK